MLRLRDLLPYLDGWKPDLVLKTNINVDYNRQLILTGYEEGYIEGGYFVTNNKYVSLIVRAGGLEIPFATEYLFQLGYRAPLKPAKKPYVLRYLEDTPGSETGLFVVDYDPIDWQPYKGNFEITVQLPPKIVWPWVSISVSSTTAKVYIFALLRILIVDREEFFKSLAKAVTAILLGKPPEAVSIDLFQKLEQLEAKLQALRAGAGVI